MEHINSLKAQERLFNDAQSKKQKFEEQKADSKKGIIHSNEW